MDSTARAGRAPGTASATVRRILDQAKRDSRTALTAPEAQGDLRRVWHHDARGGRGEIAPPRPRSGPLTWASRWSSRSSRRDILHKTEAGGVLVGLKSADEVRTRLRHDLAQRQGL